MNNRSDRGKYTKKNSVSLNCEKNNFVKVVKWAVVTPDTKGPCLTDFEEQRVKPGDVKGQKDNKFRRVGAQVASPSTFTPRPRRAEVW